MNYYYLIASLPTLSLESAPPMSLDRFRTLCSEHLGDDDLAALDELIGRRAIPTGHPFVADWNDKEVLLRNTLAGVRAARQKRDAAPYLHEVAGSDTAVEKAAHDAFTRGNPLERELALDRFRWHTIDELTGFDPFSPRAVLAYALKLRLAERWAGMSREKGLETVDQAVRKEPVTL